MERERLFLGRFLSRMFWVVSSIGRAAWGLRVTCVTWAALTLARMTRFCTKTGTPFWAGFRFENDLTGAMAGE
jgi:hypothetical protein